MSDYTAGAAVVLGRILGDNELTGGLPKGLLPLTLTPPMLVAVDVSENNMLLEEDWYPPNW